MTETYTIEAEYTDTFAGEANYSWVRRATLEIPRGTSDRAIMRRAKKALGLSGLRGKTYSNGDYWEFRPYNSCTVLFLQVRY